MLQIGGGHWELELFIWWHVILSTSDAMQKLGLGRLRLFDYYFTGQDLSRSWKTLSLECVYIKILALYKSDMI